jgi:probable HAF family extracellular repeat protein
MKRSILWALVFGLCLVSVGRAQLPPPAQGYTFKALDPPGSVDTIAHAINAYGDVVGQFADAGGVSHGFLLSNGAYRMIDFPGAPRTVATGSTLATRLWEPIAEVTDSC